MTIPVERITNMVIDYAPKVLMAILTLIVGLWIIGKLVRISRKAIAASGVDDTLAKFLGSLISIALKIMLFLSVLGMFGVNTTSFIAIFGALMVGVGMAMNGTLGHAAAGVMLMIFKPFRVGDLVEIGGGNIGTVDEINAFNTTLKTLDNKRIIIANSNVTGNDITNISGQGTVGVELTFGIGYGDDIDKARSIILDVGKSCPHILDDPAQGVVVAELGDSSVNLATRPFCKSEHYWDTMFFMQENVKKEFDKHGIGIPYPTLDVNVLPQSN
ncbi:MAG: mechanosensitive ion channel [Saprospiraceae bacterium]|nr:mechanosensitive ion channel [Saprospiraceae bacterium]